MSESSRFVWPIRVYYEDTDSGGVVYYANYLKYMERGRTEWLRRSGVEQERLKKDAGLIFAVHSLDLEYIQPARLDDYLEVSAIVQKQGKTSLTFNHDVSCKKTGAIFCRGHVRIACLNAETFKPARLPEFLSEIINVC